MSDRDERGQFVADNKVNQKHGGYSGIVHLSSGAPLVGLAAESQRAVENELATDGRAAIVRRAAIRLEAVARLFYNAIMAATEQKDFEKLALYAQRHAWLESRALAAWEQLKREERNAERGPTARDILADLEETNEQHE